ncbi:hypothetical protein G6L37_04450 [Agrobacterium rubi]|nr:hypothetical protein [Agrobacterium rubi]NTF24603.1 hypothetical protein [Agrobacterium rubi]
MSKILVGTVRARRDNGRYVVVGRDGKVMDVLFEGKHAPLIGGDVIGRVKYNKVGEAVMSLRKTLLETLLEGNVTITMLGTRPDLTARAIAKVLARSKSAMLSPGKGSSIDRMSETDDPDLAWALGVFKPEADRSGVALNVIDVQKVARSVWDNAKLRDGTLPADIEGSKRSMSDLVRLLRSGFHPECSRMIEQYSGRREISVNFILPYSPFIGASGFARRAAGMDNSIMPTTTMTVSEARRLGSARTIALGLAHDKLISGDVQADVMQSRRSMHLANCFADAAAAIAFLSSGGRRQVIEEYADLKESSLFFGLETAADVAREGILVEATHKVVRKALETDWPVGMSSSEIVASARRLATRYALPFVRFNHDRDAILPTEIEAGLEAAGRIGVDLRDYDPAVNSLCEQVYRNELRSLVDEYSANPVTAQRLVTFGRVNVPTGMMDVFYEETAGLVPQEEETPSSIVQMIGNSDRFVDRLKMARASRQDDDGLIELAESRP